MMANITEKTELGMKLRNYCSDMQGEMIVVYLDKNDKNCLWESSVHTMKERLEFFKENGPFNPKHKNRMKEFLNGKYLTVKDYEMIIPILEKK